MRYPHFLRSIGPCSARVVDCQRFSGARMGGKEPYTLFYSARPERLRLIT